MFFTWSQLVFCQQGMSRRNTKARFYCQIKQWIHFCIQNYIHDGFMIFNIFFLTRLQTGAKGKKVLVYFESAITVFFTIILGYGDCVSSSPFLFWKNLIPKKERLSLQLVIGISTFTFCLRNRTLLRSQKTVIYTRPLQCTISDF